MQLKDLKPYHKTKKKKRIARGGKRGKTSGKGTKGQKSRAGHNIRPAERDFIKKLPKRRGYRFKGRSATKNIPISLDVVNKTFDEGEHVTPKALLKKGLIGKMGGLLPRVKLLGTGTVTKKLFIQDCSVSESAKAKIEKAKGSVKSIEAKK